MWTIRIRLPVIIIHRILATIMMEKIKNMGWMVVGFDRNLKMIDFANPDGRLLFGIGTEEMAGKSVSALLAETDDRNFRQIELIRDSLLRARQEKRAVYLEYTSTLPASEKVRVAAHVRYENEDLLCFHAMEVTEEDLLHSREVDMTVAIDSESHHLLETIYKNLPVGMELYDRSGRLVEINEVGMKFMGIRDKSDVLGINIFDNPNARCFERAVTGGEKHPFFDSVRFRFS